MRGLALRLHDERVEKRPAGAFARYSRERWASGEFRGQVTGDVARTIGADWKALSTEEQQASDTITSVTKRN